MTKKEAVEKGLQTLGNAATPTQLQKHIHDHYRIEMDLKHISTAKAKILNAASLSKPAMASPTTAKPPAQQSSAPKLVVRKEEPRRVARPQGDGMQGIHLTDIETVKDLVERVRATSLKKLIDVMAR